MDNDKMTTEIDWNVFCECVNCMSIHPKGYNETKGIELPDLSEVPCDCGHTYKHHSYNENEQEYCSESCDCGAFLITLKTHADLLAQLETVKAQLAHTRQACSVNTNMNNAFLTAKEATELLLGAATALESAGWALGPVAKLRSIVNSEKFNRMFTEPRACDWCGRVYFVHEVIEDADGDIPDAYCSYSCYGEYLDDHD